MKRSNWWISCGISLFCFAITPTILTSHWCCDGEGLTYKPVQKQERKNVLFVTVDARGHFDSYTGIWDGLARRGHKVTVAFPKAAYPWYLDARTLYENENVETIQEPIFTGEEVFKAMFKPGHEIIDVASESDPFTMLKIALETFAEMRSIQMPILDAYLTTHDVDIIIHDLVAVAPRFLCGKHKIPCVSVSPLMNMETGFMGWWRPPLGMGIHPFAPSFMERIGTVVGNSLSSLVQGYSIWKQVREIDLELKGKYTGAAKAAFFSFISGCPDFNSVTLVPVPPGIDQGQVTSSTTKFVGPMRDMTRFQPLQADSMEREFLNQALKDEVPVVFMAAGVTAWITEQHIRERLAVIEQLTQDGAIRVLWANRRGDAIANSENQKVMQNLQSANPPKVLVSTWLPQGAALHHPAVKVFVTHGGSTSMMEGVAAGVPMVCSPYAFEQINNCMLLHHRHMGVYVPEQTATSVAQIVSGIHHILASHDGYSAQVELAWKRVVGFGQGENAYGARRAVHIIENAAETGLEHLRPEICNRPIYQVWYLDVLAFFGVVGAIMIGFILLVGRNCCCKRRSQNKDATGSHKVKSA